MKKNLLLVCVLSQAIALLAGCEKAEPEPLRLYAVRFSEKKPADVITAHKFVVGRGGEAGFYTDDRLTCAYHSFVSVHLVMGGSTTNLTNIKSEDIKDGPIK